MNEKKDEFKEWVVSTFDKEAEQELRRLQEKEEKFEVPEGVKEAVFERLQEQLRERNERNASRQEVEEDGNIVGRQNTEENDDNVDYRNVEEADDIINRQTAEKVDDIINCQDAEEADDIISKLSPEDREALELGRKMMKAEIGATANDRKKSRGRKRPLKIYMALAAVIICVLAMGITSIGGPERVVRMVRQAVGDNEVEKSSKSVKIKSDNNYDEEEAYQIVEENLNIEPVRMLSGPRELRFKEMVYDEENQVVEVFYKYKEKTVVYFINSSYKDSAFGINIDAKKVREYDEDINNHTFEIREYKVEGEKGYRYTAAFKEKDIEYYIIAAMNKSEFEKILNNLLFP